MTGDLVSPSDVELTHRMTEIATEIALRHFRNGVPHRSKKDGTPVSDADLEVDQVLTAMLADARPHDGVLTEESGVSAGGSGRRWIIDPIDGTVPYLAGERAWGTHIALEDAEGLQIAVMTRPTEGRLWWAVRGRGAYGSVANDPLSTTTRLRVPQTAHLSGARIGGFVPPGESAAATAIAECAEWCTDEVSVIAALLEGRMDAVLDEGGNPWDQAPGALLVSEAGGVFADPVGGRRLDLAWGLYGGSAMHAVLRPVLAAHLPKQSCPDSCRHRNARAFKELPCCCHRTT